MKGVEEILQQHSLKNTKLRKAVLSVLMRSDKGLSHQDLSRSLEVDFDRVTLFRTLHVFEESGILHKIMDPHGIAKYAYTAKPVTGKHCHAHFICLECGQVFCLDEEFPLEEVKVPKGFSKKTIDVQIKGYCNKCAAQS
ncbi:Fur family transcriptional regulator [Taibaiella helva]|uniref:Fur family transcriptional regulator n=1 Tax=Taibaiella helva TaxID=2301235 RepID=UPI000E5699E2|nr:Fur family transcriptional regulator [Taibaiella helva]